MRARTHTNLLLPGLAARPWRLIVMRRARLVACHAVAVGLCAAREVRSQPEHTLTEAEQKHLRPFWRIGDGFEGTASDWTEYVVWLVGVIGVFYYMANPNARQNLHHTGDEPDWGDESLMGEGEEEDNDDKKDD